MIEPLFWISVGAILYTYIGYPVTIWILGELRKREVYKSEIAPSVSVVLACHNEQVPFPLSLLPALRLNKNYQ